MAYSLFARYYDALTRNVDYPARAALFHRLLGEHGVPEAGILLDVGCGTGSLSFALAGLGYDVIGADPSMEMLSAAMGKGGDSGQKVLFLHQSMEGLDLYGTVDCAVCALDTVNHILKENTLAEGFARVSLFLTPGGVFLFDVNTAYKHREVLADSTFVYDLDEVFCVWQNRYRQEHHRVDITLDFFEPVAGSQNRYLRGTECLAERIYGHEQLTRLLAAAGLELLAVYEGDAGGRTGPRSQRLIYVARKPK